ncbi:two-component system sensor histidine kinase YesM [Fontibacillus phaseoli]|uniref:histidine kinase n=1 Tax=Fontibacillus phaseoli TaxID=1416533 RepID=A0A369BKB3_9BACL|nr:sensor histidine kinase [Fontibacillus phaseoli]RCX21555.1 two-component system sensor histidine kinase YesM [Fontibacillus phaseoli]
MKKHLFGNFSLRKKLLIILALFGLAPLITTFTISYLEIKQETLNSQNYAVNQNYEQALTSLSDRFRRIEKLSTMIILNDVLVDALNQGPENMDIGEQIFGFEKIDSYTKILEESSESDGIVYYIDDRFVVSGTDTRFRKLRFIEGKPWAQKVLTSTGEPVWFSYSDVRVTGSIPYLALGRILWNVRDYQDSIGMVVIHMDLQPIRAILTKTVPEQTIGLMDSKGHRIAISQQEEALTRLPFLKETGNGFEAVQLDGKDYLYRSNQIGKSGIYLTTMIPKEAASAAVNKVGSQILTMYIVVIAILLILIYPVTKSITGRVFLLIRKMDQIRRGELRKLDIEPSQDEIGRLVSSYNYMINSVQELLQEQYRLGVEKIGAELKALQSQINPHFLYNTLDMLNWMAQREERSNIQQVVYALSDYYKLILNKGEDFVTLKDELRLSSIYVEIQQRRFKDRIVFKTDIEDDALDCMLPKITLQPLVENSILHGITEKPEGKGNIFIRGRVCNNRLVLTIEDDGIGMSYHRDGRPRTHGSGYGVKNIEKRLELYFGEQRCIYFESNPGTGTRVFINVPVVRNDVR